MILYFTGTGNSRFIANKLGAILNDDVVAINNYMKTQKKGVFQSEKPYIFVNPSYMSRMPMAVEAFIKSADFYGNRNSYFVFAAAEAVGNSHKYCKKLCIEKKLAYQGCTAIAMPANYVVMYDVTPKSEARSIVEQVVPTIQKVAKEIQSGSALSENPNMSGHKTFSIIAPIFNSLMTSSKAFNVNNSCISCGVCKKLCPQNNINLNSGKPTWGNNCMHCMACISVCPKKAINYGKKTIKRNRYYLND